MPRTRLTARSQQIHGATGAPRESDPYRRCQQWAVLILLTRRDLRRRHQPRHPAAKPLRLPQTRNDPRPATDHPQARSARPREPASPHRIHRQNQYETVTPCNPKNRLPRALPPGASPPPASFRISPQTHSPQPLPAHPNSKTRHPESVSALPAATINQKSQSGPRVPPWALFASGLQGTFCGAKCEAASPRPGAALGQSASRSETAPSPSGPLAKESPVA
jgi:hypothetical protein